MMNNPYEVPKAELVVSEEFSHYKTLRWKLLFFLLLPLELWSEYDAFTINQYDDSLQWRLLSLMVYSFFFIGLFGLSFRRKIFTSRFWLWFVPVPVLFDCIDIASMLQQTPAEEAIFAYGVLAVFSPLLLVSWYAVFKYSKVLKGKHC